ncbi:hypothetical protein [Scytonema sp. PCC 10023]|uniref:hypothetical protein n=1 Tax=Scytonema sp. PCC 10023 TaxID=1680591 RepID=UPI0039C71745
MVNINSPPTIPEIDLSVCLLTLCSSRNGTKGVSAVSTAGQLSRLPIPVLRPDTVLNRDGVFDQTKTGREVRC